MIKDRGVVTSVRISSFPVYCKVRWDGAVVSEVVGLKATERYPGAVTNIYVIPLSHASGERISVVRAGPRIINHHCNCLASWPTGSDGLGHQRRLHTAC